MFASVADFSRTLLTSDRQDLPPGAFTRDGDLGPERVLALLLFMTGRSGRGYTEVLEAFWEEAAASGTDLGRARPVSGAAFCKARRKIPAATVWKLVEQVRQSFEKRFGKSLRWRRRRLLAVDGTKFNVQRSRALVEAYGVPNQGHYPQALVTTLFDVVAKTPVAATVGSHASSERAQLRALLPHLRPGDVLLGDRGYPGFEVFADLVGAGVDFVLRVATRSTFAAVAEFLRSGGRDAWTEFHPPKEGPCRNRAPLRLRLVRVRTPDGAESVLATTLLKEDASAAEVRNLYRRRWEIEEFYKLLKVGPLDPGMFHSCVKDGVEQELAALALYTLVARYLMAAAARRARKPFAWLAPRTAVLGLADTLVRLLLGTNPDVRTATLGRLLARIARSARRKRPSRSYPRRSVQPQVKWTKTGRRGR